jgi:TetR/AcrR family transcriptional regulator
MAGGRAAAPASPRRWGTDSALRDDDEARRRLLAATTRCIVARGSAQITVEEVAREAGVTRSTVYRYFDGRDALLLGVLLDRLDMAGYRMISGLRRPDDARRSLVDLVVGSIELVPGDPVNEALFSSESSWLVTALELGAEDVVDVSLKHLGPLLARWQEEGQLHGDLDLRETIRWINAFANLLLASPYKSKTTRARRQFVERYLVRALVPAGEDGVRR